MASALQTVQEENDRLRVQLADERTARIGAQTLLSKSLDRMQADGVQVIQLPGDAAPHVLAADVRQFAERTVAFCDQMRSFAEYIIRTAPLPTLSSPAARHAQSSLKTPPGETPRSAHQLWPATEMNRTVRAPAERQLPGELIDDLRALLHDDRRKRVALDAIDVAYAERYGRKFDARRLGYETLGSMIAKALPHDARLALVSRKGQWYLSAANTTPSSRSPRPARRARSPAGSGAQGHVKRAASGSLCSFFNQTHCVHEGRCRFVHSCSRCGSGKHGASHCTTTPGKP